MRKLLGVSFKLIFTMLLCALILSCSDAEFKGSGKQQKATPLKTGSNNQIPMNPGQNPQQIFNKAPDISIPESEPMDPDEEFKLIVGIGDGEIKFGPDYEKCGPLLLETQSVYVKNFWSFGGIGKCPINSAVVNLNDGAAGILSCCPTPGDKFLLSGSGLSHTLAAEIPDHNDVYKCPTGWLMTGAELNLYNKAGGWFAPLCTKLNSALTTTEEKPTTYGYGPTTIPAEITDPEEIADWELRNDLFKKTAFLGDGCFTDAQYFYVGFTESTPYLDHTFRWDNSCGNDIQAKIIKK